MGVLCHVVCCAALDVAILLGYIYFNKYILFLILYILNICIYSSSNSVSLGVGIVKGRGSFFIFGEVVVFD